MIDCFRWSASSGNECTSDLRRRRWWHGGDAGRDFMATALRVPSTPPPFAFFASLAPSPPSFPRLSPSFASLPLPFLPLCRFPSWLPPHFSLLLTNVFLSAPGSRGRVQGEMRDIAVQTANYSFGHVGTFGMNKLHLFEELSHIFYYTILENVE